MTTSNPLPSRRIGDLLVTAVGLGCMPLSFERMLGDRPRAMATIHTALDAGITLLDTANIYAPSWDSMGHNEVLVGEALRSWGGSAAARGRVVVTTKGGITRGPGETWGRDASRGGLLAAAEASRQALGVEVIDLYQLHRLDPSIPMTAQVASLVAVRDSGLASRIGLSNVTLEELEVALDVAGGPGDGGIVSVQNEWSPRFRAHADVIDRCAELGIAFLPWSPLGGADQAADVGSRYAAFAEIAAARAVSPQRVVLAWLLARSPVTIPIPGSTRPDTVLDSVGSLHLHLNDDEIQRLDASAPDAESMYPEDQPRPPLR